MHTYRQVWDGLLVVAAGACLVAAAGPAAAVDYVQIIDQYVAGEEGAEEVILEGGNEAIEALEDRLLAEQELDEAAVRELVEAMGSDQFETRERATRCLQRSGDRIVPLLSRLREAAQDPETCYRLDGVLETLQAWQYAGGLPDLLASLYGESIVELASQRMKRLEADPYDGRGLLFVKLAPTAEVWQALAESDGRSKIMYLLARLHALHDHADVDSWLRTCSGPQVLELAAATYWPLELEPLSQSLGGYHAVRAARVEGTRAYDVLSFDFDASADSSPSDDDGSDPNDDSSQQDGDSVVEPDQRIMNCDSYIMWIYLWRYETADPSVSTPYGEGVVLGVLGDNVVRLLAATRIDPEMKLPVVRMSRREKHFWKNGSALEWARPLIPAEYLDLIHFRKRSRYEPAEILEMPE